MLNPWTSPIHPPPSFSHHQAITRTITNWRLWIPYYCFSDCLIFGKQLFWSKILSLWNWFFTLFDSRQKSVQISAALRFYRSPKNITPKNTPESRPKNLVYTNSIKNPDQKYRNEFSKKMYLMHHPKWDASLSRPFSTTRNRLLSILLV